MTKGVSISVIVPVTEDTEATIEVAKAYISALNLLGKTFEILFIIDGEKRKIFELLNELTVSDKRIRLIKFAKSFGDATAIAAGFRNSNGRIILTMPEHLQIDPTSIQVLVDSLDNCDMAVACRRPNPPLTIFGKYRRKIFHWLIGVLSGENFSDLSCAARAFKREILTEIPLYGEQHIFLPLLASKQGFHVTEVAVDQGPIDHAKAPTSRKFYLQRFLDIFTIVFLVRFTKKPIRLFGMVGSIIFVFGLTFLLYIIFERLVFDVALADRPALLVSSLLVVLGLQIFSLGLLGELIIFTHARDIKEYTIEKIVN